MVKANQTNRKRQIRVMTQRDKCESDLLHRVSPGESGRGNWFTEFLVDEVFVFIKQSFPFFPIKRPLPDSRHSVFRSFAKNFANLSRSK
jgi:hypothetical protein